MPFTDFPNGLTSFGIPLLGGGESPATIPISSGKYIFANALGGPGGSGDGTSMYQPLPSVFAAGGAYAQATAAKGDVIVALPGHTETISSATGALMTKSGVQIVGIGNGTLQPKFTLDTANDTAITVSAANQSISNCRIVANFLSIAAPFVLTTARWFTVNNCYIFDTSSVLNFLNIVKSTGAANTVDGLTFANNWVSNLGVTSNNTTILSANDVDRLTMYNNKIHFAVQNDIAIGAIISAGVVTNLDIGYNKFYRPNTSTTGGSIINVGGSTSTGWVYNNYVQTLDTSADIIFTTTSGLGAFNNFVTGVVGASGFLIPTADT